MRVLISGATQGLGEALLFECLRRYPQSRIVGFSRKVENAKALLSKISTENPEYAERVVLIQGDIETLSKVNEIVEQAKHILGGIDLLINNVGVFSFDRDLAEVSPEDWHLDEGAFTARYGNKADFEKKKNFWKMAQVNYLGGKSLIDAVAAENISQNLPLRVITVGSIGAAAELLGRPLGNTAFYGRTKAALASHTIEIARQNALISSCVVHPGPFEKSAQAIADEFGDTWATKTAAVACYAFDLVEKLDRQKIVQGIICSERHFFWSEFEQDLEGLEGITDISFNRVAESESLHLIRK